ncbi:MAG: flagellar biosynthesis anti-sigma factor FlgM [Terracidiphilus sp.]
MSIQLPDDLNEDMALLEVNGGLDEAPIDEGRNGRGAYSNRLGGGPRNARAEAGAMRLDKIKKVRAALSAGTYSVPAEAVAIKMLDAMLALERKRVREDRRKRPRVGHRRLMRGRARRENG